MIGWGGEDVPGHPVPINKEGNACMHMQRDNEGIRLPKLLGLAVAGATLLAGMVVLPATQASAAEDYGYNAEDDFVQGPVVPTKTPRLTVTMYLSLAKGFAPTGSSKDAEALAKTQDLTPAKDVLFHVEEVQPVTGKDWGDIKASDPNTYTQTGNSFAGITNGQGVIDTWYDAADGKIKNADEHGFPVAGETPKAFPTATEGGKVHYYILFENKDASWAFNPQNPNKLDTNKYGAAENSFFGLPYAAQSLNATKANGYIYNLHLYPKSKNKSVFSKTVQDVLDSKTNEAKNQRTAVAGDKIDYKLSQTIANNGSAVAKDGILDVSELKGDYKDILFVDRMSSALKLDESTVAATLYYTVKGADNKSEVKHVALTDQKANATAPDFKWGATDKSPKRINGTGTMFPDTQDAVQYYQFQLFGGGTSGTVISTLTGATGATDIHVDVTYQATVTPLGDSTATDGVANDAASDFSENTSDVIKDHTNVMNAGLAFGSVKNKDSQFAALPGTEYRLVANSDSLDKYLATDGDFHTTSDLPKGAQFYQATANSDGLVAFAGLPIFSSESTESKASTGDSGEKVRTDISWKLVETNTPEGWRNPGVAFGTVTFSNVAGKSVTELAQTYGPHGVVQPNYDELQFKNFEVSPASITTKIKFNNQDVSKYEQHFANTDTDAPLALPLTGGRGIVLLLVVGALIMGGALYARSRRNSSARA